MTQEAWTVGHATGFLTGVRLPLYLGTRAVYQEVWNAEEFVRLVEAEHVTYTAGGDTAPGRYCARAKSGFARRPLIAHFHVWRASIPRPLAREAVTVPGCRLLPEWGLSEVGPVTTTYPDDPIERVVTTDGRVYPQMELTVRDP
jgi:acyl-CoA synthetase (AMP-forming)/AMP-acid ligase II